MHYQKPPVTEAVIGLKLTDSIDAKKLKTIRAKLRSQYPFEEPQQSIDLEKLQISGSAQTFPLVEGVRFASSDQADVVILMGNNVVVARNAPYTIWEDLFSRFSAVVQVLSKQHCLSGLSRIGVRYINRIDIPVTGESLALQEYLKIFPYIPPECGSEIVQGLAQVQVRTHVSPWKAQITMAKIESPLVEHISVMLDIDVFCDEQVPHQPAPLLDMVAAARDVKNGIFKSCITLEAERLFE